MKSKTIRETPAERRSENGWAYKLVRTKEPLTEREQAAWVDRGELPKERK